MTRALNDVSSTIIKAVEILYVLRHFQRWDLVLLCTCKPSGVWIIIYVYTFETSSFRLEVTTNGPLKAAPEHDWKIEPDTKLTCLMLDCRPSLCPVIFAVSCRGTITMAMWKLGKSEVFSHKFECQVCLLCLLSTAYCRGKLFDLCYIVTKILCWSPF